MPFPSDITFAIYYDDETIFSSEDGAFEDAPSDGVLFIAQRLEGSDIVEMHSGNDFYIWLEGQVVDTGDLGPYLRSLGTVKFGRHTTHKRFEQVSEQVRHDWKPRR